MDFISGEILKKEQVVQFYSYFLWPPNVSTKKTVIASLEILGINWVLLDSTFGYQLYSDFNLCNQSCR